MPRGAGAHAEGAAGGGEGEVMMGGHGGWGDGCGQGLCSSEAGTGGVEGQGDWCQASGRVEAGELPWKVAWEDARPAAPCIAGGLPPVVAFWGRAASQGRPGLSCHGLASQRRCIRSHACAASSATQPHPPLHEKDVACAQCPLPAPGRLGEASVSLFCVFDGHCGRGAAEAAAVVLPEEIGVRLPACEADMLEQRGAVSALRPAFLATDARIRAEEGCTATAVLAWSPRKGTVCLQVAGGQWVLFVWSEALHGMGRQTGSWRGRG